MKSSNVKVAPRSSKEAKSRRAGLNGVLESKKARRQAYAEYRRFIQGHYDGLAGTLTGFTGLVTGHETLAGRLIGPRAFDIRGCKRILDAACGNGRYSKFLAQRADRGAFITGFDLSQSMLRRARKRLGALPVSHVAADLTRLPYPDAFFDAIVCGWALEHLPDPKLGLRELARILQPGGKILLMVTENTFTGSLCSRMWHCLTYSRGELMRVCQECGLRWERPLWFTRLHRLFHLGGIIVELHRDE